MIRSRAAPSDIEGEERWLERRALGSLIALLLLGLVDNQILSPVLPEIARSFGVTVGRVGLTVSGYALCAAAAALIAAPLSDRRGRRPFLLGAGLAFALASLGAYTAPGFTSFALARAAAGSAAGILSALVVASIADRVPYARRGRAMGWVASAYFAAPILGVPLFSWMADGLGWRSIYAAFFFLGLTAAGSFGLWGAADETRPQDHDDARSSAGTAAAGYFRFFGDRSTAAGALSAFFVSGGITLFITYLGAYLSESFGLSVTAIGLVFLLSGAASLLGAFGAGAVADRWGKRGVAIAGSLLLAASLAAIPAFGGGLPLYAALGIVGFSAASRVAPLQSLVTELVSRERRGAYVALRNTLSQLGIAVSASLGAVLYVQGGFQPVCYTASALSAGAAVLLLVVKEPGNGGGASAQPEPPA